MRYEIYDDMGYKVYDDSFTTLDEAYTALNYYMDENPHKIKYINEYEIREVYYDL